MVYFLLLAVIILIVVLIVLYRKIKEKLINVEYKINTYRRQLKDDERISTSALEKAMHSDRVSGALATFVEENRDKILMNQSSIIGLFDFLERSQEFKDFVNGRLMQLMSDPNFDASQINLMKTEKKDDNNEK